MVNLLTKETGQPKPFASLMVKGKRVFQSNIEVSPTSAQYTKQRNYLLTDEEAITYLKGQIVEGEYLGECNVIKYNRLGLLVQLQNGTYAVLSTAHTVFYVSSYLTDFHMLPKEGETVAEVGGQQVDVAKIELSYHYIQNVSERLKLPEESARPVLLDTVINGTYIGVTHDKEERKPAHLYAKEGKLIYISTDLKKALTVYTNGFSGGFIHPNVNTTIVDTLKTEITKLLKQEKEIERRNYVDKLHSTLKIAQLDLDRYRCRTDARYEEITDEMEAERQGMCDKEREWENMVDLVRQNAIALAAFV